MCDYNMIYCTIIVENFTQKPNSLELDPTKGFMFYTKLTELGNLERANLDGTNQTILVSHKIIYPYGLSIDLANEHIYWVDRYMDSIERIDYNGKHRWSLKKSAISSIILKSLHSICIFENTIYLSSWQGKMANQTIVAVSKYDANTAHVIVQNLTYPNSLRIFHRQKQLHIQKHPCENGGGCDQICITAYRKNQQPYAQCLCAPGYRLKTRSQCALIKHSSYLIYAKQRPAMIKGIAMTTAIHSTQSNGIESIVPILNVKWPLTLDYNVHEELIYFGQNDMNTDNFIIESQKIDGTGRKSLMSGSDNCDGIAYDWVGYNMYLATTNRISVFGLRNNSMRTLIQTTDTG